MSFHFIGLGGIGMSALARILLQRGKSVHGSDHSPSAILEELKQEGAGVRIGHTGDLNGASTVVYSSAVRAENADLLKAKELNLKLLHRSELLDALMTGLKPLLVTGTHGKTTTTALLASVLVEAELDPTFVIGGIHKEWKTNGRAGAGQYFVAEADESDGSFLKTPYFGAIVTNLENDHLDYWKSEERLDGAFGEFFALAAHPEHLFWCGDDPRLAALKPQGVSYGFGDQNQLRVISEPTPQGVRFSVNEHKEIDLALFGRHNALNGAAVFALALSLGISDAIIRRAFALFAGTGRRLEYRGKVGTVDVYDDYGHHPTEIATTLQGLRDKILERRLVAVFQPHRYTRVRDLFETFWTAFDEADLVVMTDIYGAGEEPIISTEALYTQMRGKLGDKIQYIPRDKLEKELPLQQHDVVLTLGAGDITKLHIQSVPEKLKVAVLYGGTSSEHAVSLMSAETIINGLDRTLYEVVLFPLSKQGEWERNMSELKACDVAIPVFHGQQGEDGMIQGLLDTLNVPYVGCDYRSGALCMQKGWTKQIAIAAGIPTSPFIEMDKVTHRRNPELLAKQIDSYPVWVKPVHLGSSIGITRVVRPEDLAAAVDFAFSLDDTLIVDKEVVGREIEFSMLGNDYVRVAPAGEIIKENVFHSYDKKYGAGASEIVVADLTESELEKGKALAIAMYRRAGCKGLSRIDFFLDQNGQFWMNEINPFPGFTKTSAYPQMWGEGGLPISKLCDELIILALHRHRQLTLIRGR